LNAVKRGFNEVFEVKQENTREETSA